MAATLIFLTTLLALQTPSPMDQIETTIKAIPLEKDLVKKGKMSDETQAAILGLIQADELKLPTDFRRAATLLRVENGSSFELSQIKYECALTALAAGDPEAAKIIGEQWDTLLVSMSRGQRLGAIVVDKKYGGHARYRTSPTAKAIINVYRDPKRTLATAKAGRDNPELQKIVDEDQRVRQDWSKFTAKDYIALAQSDEARLRRTKDIVRAGAIATANDFANAALVCQHGETFEDYALAHELSVCAVQLGKASESWLAGASYDRMLSNCGYHQRFATQYFSIGQVFKLNKVDTDYINDTERKLVVRKTLQEAKDMKWK